MNALSLQIDLTIYRQILRDDVIVAYGTSDFIPLLIERAHNLGLSGNIFRQYLIHTFLYDENIFSISCENGEDIEGSGLYDYAMDDIHTLQLLCDLDVQAPTDYRSISAVTDPVVELLEKALTAEEKMRLLIGCYKTRGAGSLARFHMFSVNEDGSMRGIRHYDKISFEQIIGCGWQKEALRVNTEAFLAGKPVNNVLLVGSRGSGKSSCVKALVNQYHDKGLRLVEVQRGQLLPGLIEKLAARGKHFIIFMDDLSYGQFETEYKYLKSLLEGGAETRPDNILFYATSNRRHIVTESWNDRNSDDELHINDTINEKMSLSDRFGLTLLFPHINQEEYLRIVTVLAAKHGINIDTETLHAKALQWSVEHKRMSGRSAAQFLRCLEGEL